MYTCTLRHVQAYTTHTHTHKHTWSQHKPWEEKKVFKCSESLTVFPLTLSLETRTMLKTPVTLGSKDTLKNNEIKMNVSRLSHNGFLVHRKTSLLFYPHMGAVAINYSAFGKCFEDKMLSAKNPHQFSASHIERELTVCSWNWTISLTVPASS